MNASFNVQHFGREEKLRITVIIRQDLSPHPQYEVPSPEWHGAHLKETEDLYASGEESALDWESVKDELWCRWK